MSILLNKYFKDVESISSKEFLNFFQISQTEEERERLLQRYYDVKQNNGDIVDFPAISESAQHYDKLMELLGSIENLKGRLDDFMYQIQKQKVNKTNYVDCIAELMIVLDIYQYIKNLSKSSFSSVQRFFDFLQAHSVKNDNSAKKIEKLINESKKIITANEDSLQKINSAQNSKDTQDIQGNFRKIQNQLNELSSEVKYIRSDMKNQDIREDDLLIERRCNSFAEERTELLTNQVWPKPRMLFAIIGKMEKEGYITLKQKGDLKNLIIENDYRLLGYLKEYQIKGDKNQLYQNMVRIVCKN